MDIIYTPYPMDLILKEEKQDNQFNFKNIRYQGIEMQVEPLSWNEVKVIRLYSTNPGDYLDNNLQPGSIIALNE